MIGRLAFGVLINSGEPGSTFISCDTSFCLSLNVIWASPPDPNHFYLPETLIYEPDYILVRPSLVQYTCLRPSDLLSVGLPVTPHLGFNYGEYTRNTSRRNIPRLMEEFGLASGSD